MLKCPKAEDRALPEAWRPSSGWTEVEHIPAAKEPEPPLKATPELTHIAVKASTPPPSLSEVSRLTGRPARVIRVPPEATMETSQNQLEENPCKDRGSL